MAQVWLVLRSIIDYLRHLDYENIKEIIKTKSGLFVVGFLGGGGSASAILFLDAGPEHVAAGVVIIKAIGGLLLAFATGIATALGKGYVEGRKKEKEIMRRKKADKEFKDDQKPLWGKNGTHH